MTRRSHLQRSSCVPLSPGRPLSKLPATCTPCVLSMKHGKHQVRYGHRIVVLFTDSVLNRPPHLILEVITRPWCHKVHFQAKHWPRVNIQRNARRLTFVARHNFCHTCWAQIKRRTSVQYPAARIAILWRRLWDSCTTARTSSPIRELLQVRFCNRDMSMPTSLHSKDM